MRYAAGLKTVTAAHTHTHTRKSRLAVGLYPTNMDYVKGS